MEHNSTETVAPDVNDENVEVCDEDVTAEEDMDMNNLNTVLSYVQQNPHSTNTQLFSFLVLLNTYIPESFLLMSECQQILGPPDPIHGGPPFEERMTPFISFIDTSNPEPGHVCVTHPVIALRVMEKLAHLRIFRSATVKKFMNSLGGNEAQPYIIQYIKDLLRRREMGEKGKNKFSCLITDIMEQENVYYAVSVLKTASDKFKLDPMFPQTLARLYYVNRYCRDYKRAQYWAKEAIRRAPNNSYVADTLGQIYKNLLRQAKTPEDIRAMAEEAFRAFKDVEEKAEREEGPEMRDAADHKSTSNSFNNRGLFGFIQVAKTAFEKGQRCTETMDVQCKFDFFEWYLIYSKPDMTTLEPHYFWRDVALCYEYYTEKAASDSTSFPGLLDCLNHGLFMSKGRRAGFGEAEKNVSDLEKILGDLKTAYEENVDSVEVAERYILSNIILSHKMPNSPRLTPVAELKTIIQKFLETEVGRRSPEFYLLVLLLFWPEEQGQKDDHEEEDQQTTHDDESEDKTWDDEVIDEEEKTGGESAQLPVDVMFAPDLEQCATLMEQAFERGKHAKYLHRRYLLPLFFLGKGSGLSKWIHKSKLDVIVQKKVDPELAGECNRRNKEKQINDMWVNGEVWQVPEIRDILLPVAVDSPTMPQDQVFVCVGGKKIKATEDESSAASQSPMLYYLGFTIRGPVVFKVGCPHMFGQ